MRVKIESVKKILKSQMQKGDKLMKHKFKVLAALLATGAMLTCACGSDTSGISSVQLDSSPGHGKWIDSDIKGNITADYNTRVQDDFAAAKNKDAIVSGEVEKVSMNTMDKVVIDRKKQILEDESISGEGMDLLRDYAELASDWDYRNQAGVEPLRPYIESIEAISSMDEYYDFICDPYKNPLDLGPLRMSKVIASQDEKGKQLIYIAPIKFTLSSDGSSKDPYFLIDDYLEYKESITEGLQYMLGRLGYDDKRIGEIITDNFAIEKAMARIDNSILSNESDYRYTFKECLEFDTPFPFEKYYKSLGITDEDQLFLIDRSYAEDLKKVLTEDNLEKLKASLISQYIIGTFYSLDYETVEKIEELYKPKVSKPDEETFTKEETLDSLLFDGAIGYSAVGPIMDQAYAEKFYNEESRNRLYSMTEDIIDACGEMFQNEKWLSDEGKKICQEKLDAMCIHIITPDYSQITTKGLDFASKAEGGSFLEAQFCSNRFLSKKKVEFAASAADRAIWNPYFDSSTTEVNCYYKPQANSIYILAGFLSDPVYNENMSTEQLLGGIGCVVGHEITHGFDSAGVQFDKDGFMNDILETKDTMAFNDKTDKVAAYYKNIKPYAGAGSYEGERLVPESVADMGGMKEALIVASKIEDFNYDEFFTQFAHMWAFQNTLEDEKYIFESDEHPLAYLRINITIQQFDEFYKTYDVKPGDGMYLEPEKRISIW